MESVKGFKFMNGWVVKHKNIDKIEEAIWVNRETAMKDCMYMVGRLRSKWPVVCSMKKQLIHCVMYAAIDLSKNLVDL